MSLFSARQLWHWDVRCYLGYVVFEIKGNAAMWGFWFMGGVYVGIGVEIAGGLFKGCEERLRRRIERVEGCRCAV